MIQADGLVIVTPEYNHGYPGSLKAVLDLLAS
jgi:NAD(P)H-dependent FMN reductase